MLFVMSLLPQPGAGFGFVFEVLNRVLERNTVMLQETIELVAGRNVQKIPKLMTGNPVHPIRVDGESLECRSGEILPVFSQLLNDLVREFQRYLHPASIGQTLRRHEPAPC